MHLQLLGSGLDVYLLPCSLAVYTRAILVSTTLHSCVPVYIGELACNHCEMRAPSGNVSVVWPSHHRLVHRLLPHHVHREPNVS